MATTREQQAAFEKGQKDGKSFKNSNAVSELINPSYRPPADRDVQGAYRGGFKTGSKRK